MAMLSRYQHRQHSLITDSVACQWFYMTMHCTLPVGPHACWRADACSYYWLVLCIMNVASRLAAVGTYVGVVLGHVASYSRYSCGARSLVGRPVRQVGV